MIDRFLPRYDFAVTHASVFRAPPEVCYQAARGLDLLGDPVIRTLLGLRSLPQRVADRLGGNRAASVEGVPTFGLDDMVRNGWILLGEKLGVEIVFGQIGRPWKPVGASSGPSVEKAGFAAFDEPGFAKIAFSLRVQPYGAARRSSRWRPDRLDRPEEPATVRALLGARGTLRPPDRPDDAAAARRRAPPAG